MTSDQEETGRPVTDLVQGTLAKGRVTLWTFICSCADGKQIIPPTTKSKAKLAMLDHMKEHSDMRQRQNISQMRKTIDFQEPPA